MSNEVVFDIKINDKEWEKFNDTFSKFGEEIVPEVEEGLERLGEKANVFSESMSELQNIGKGISKNFQLVTLSITGAVIALVAFASKISEGVRGSYMLGKNTGTATKNVEALGFALKWANVANDEGMGEGVIERIHEMQTDPTQVGLLTMHNVDHKGVDATKVFLDLITAIRESTQAVPTSLKQIQTLGFSASQSSGILAGAPIHENFKEAQSSIKVTDSDAKKMVLFTKEIDHLGIAFKHLGRRIIVELIPYLQQFVKFIRTAVEDGWVDKFVKGLKAIGEIMIRFARFMGWVDLSDEQKQKKESKKREVERMLWNLTGIPLPDSSNQMKLKPKTKEENDAVRKEYNKALEAFKHQQRSNKDNNIVLQNTTNIIVNGKKTTTQSTNSYPRDLSRSKKKVNNDAIIIDARFS